MDKIFKHIRPKKALDIGAHLGNFSKELGYNVPECDIIMVEANRNCEAALRLLGKRYEIVALSDKEGFADLFLEKINPVGTGASLYKENTEWYAEGSYETVRVPLKTLDSRNYFDGEIIDLVKLDVQGGELDIIRGGKKTIAKTKFVLSETSLVQYNQGAPLVDEVVNEMVDLGFCMVDFIEYHKFTNDQIFQIDILFKNQNLN